MGCLDTNALLYIFYSLFLRKPMPPESPKTNSEWHEVSPGSYERRFDSTERTLDYLTRVGLENGRSAVMVSSGVKFNFQPNARVDIVDVVRHAWISLRHQQPNIAATFDRKRRRRVYKTASREELHDWLLETFRVELELTSTQLFPLLPLVERPTIYVLPKSSEIIFRCPHITIDGMGTLSLWDDLLSIMSNPRLGAPLTFGDEGKNLPPSLFAAIKVPFDHKKKKYFDASYCEVSKYSSKVPTIGLPYTPALERGAAQSRTKIFSKAETDRIITAARERGWTPTHCFNAALIIATQMLGPDPTATRYSDGVSFCQRYWCRPETKRFNVSVYLATYRMEIDAADFATTADSVKAFFNRIKNMDDTDRFATLRVTTDLMAYCVKRYSKKRKTTAAGPPRKPSSPSSSTASSEKAAAARATPPNMPEMAHPHLNSLGLIEKRLKRRYGRAEEGAVLEVTDFWPAVDVLTPDLPVYLFTWRDAIRLSTCYNSAYHSKSIVDNLHLLVVDILMTGLGLGKSED